MRERLATRGIDIVTVDRRLGQEVLVAFIASGSQPPCSIHFAAWSPSVRASKAPTLPYIEQGAICKKII
jgi:hypothetical protein